ncbi:unnamed protein product [Spodoptera littoralis]|uniref:Uncharacterized protein n=1 Tax=Spodoptera littoralis TaxID=7109 RepID=A0A9P0HVN9_SPOLI|nr:unnamed protein product [Spodoptera littoralis]CAH1634785.1 unnamed protein product [Spodoptera littoralis]
MGRGQELLNAAREGDKRTVEKILGQITNISGPFTSLRRGAGVNVQDDNGYTPLHQACLNGHREIVRVLLSVGANPGIVDKKGATPLHLAAFNGDTDVCWMLLAHNPPVNIDQLTSDHETALLIAAQFGFVNVVGQLISRGADVTIKNNNDESALDLAAQYGRLAVVQHLLQVRPQLVDQYRYPACRNVIFTSTPLHRASKNGRKDVVTALIDAGMDPNVRTHSGTPLHEAARFGKPSVVRILLNKGADLHAQDSSRKTVYDLLAEYPEEATRKVRKVIRGMFQAEYENLMGNFDSDKELPPFPVQDYSPDAVMSTHILKPPAIVLDPKTPASPNNNDRKKISVTNAQSKTPPPEPRFKGHTKSIVNHTINVDMRQRSESFDLKARNNKQFKIIGNAISSETACTELLENQNQLISEFKSRNKSKAEADSGSEKEDNAVSPVERRIDLGKQNVQRVTTIEQTSKTVTTGSVQLNNTSSAPKKVLPTPTPKPIAYVSKFIPEPDEDHIDSIYANSCVKVEDYPKCEAIEDNIYENVSRNLTEDDDTNPEYDGPKTDYVIMDKFNHQQFHRSATISGSVAKYEIFSKTTENFETGSEGNYEDYVSMSGTQHNEKSLSVQLNKTDLVHLRGDIGCIYEPPEYLYIYEINPQTYRGNVHPFTKKKQKAKPMPCYCHEDPDREEKIRERINRARHSDGSQLLYHSCQDIYVAMKSKEGIYSSLNDLSTDRDIGSNERIDVNDASVVQRYDNNENNESNENIESNQDQTRVTGILKKKMTHFKQLFVDW